MKKKILLNYVLLSSHENTQGLLRRVVLIGPHLYYESSGKNSKHEGTWFPFDGLSEHTTALNGWVRSKPGLLIKPSMHNLRFGRIFEDKQDRKDILKRLPNLPCLLLSSMLGGGYWDKNGNLLRERLKNPDNPFYPKDDPVEFSFDDYKFVLTPWLDENDQVMSFSCQHPKEFNDWARSQVKNGEFLIPNCLKTMVELLDSFESYIPPETSPIPATLCLSESECSSTADTLELSLESSLCQDIESPRDGRAQASKPRISQRPLTPLFNTFSRAPSLYSSTLSQTKMGLRRTRSMPG